MLESNIYWCMILFLWNREPDAATSVNDGRIDSTTVCGDKRSMYMSISAWRFWSLVLWINISQLLFFLFIIFLLWHKSGFKTTGVQADLANHSDLSKKLLDIWRTSNYQDPRRNLISELLLACSTDLQILFGFMNTSTPPQGKDRQAAKTLSNMQSSKALESENECQLYSAVTKVWLLVQTLLVSIKS